MPCACSSMDQFNWMQFETRANSIGQQISPHTNSSCLCIVINHLATHFCVRSVFIEHSHMREEESDVFISFRFSRCCVDRWRALKLSFSCLEFCFPLTVFVVLVLFPLAEYILQNSLKSYNVFDKCFGALINIDELNNTIPERPKQNQMDQIERTILHWKLRMNVKSGVGKICFPLSMRKWGISGGRST